MRVHRLLLGGLAVGLWSVSAVADDSTDQTKLDISKIIATMGEGMSISMPDKEGKLPDFKKVTEGMESKEGLFTLWYYPPEAKDKDVQIRALSYVGQATRVFGARQRILKACQTRS